MSFSPHLEAARRPDLAGSVRRQAPSARPFGEPIQPLARAGASETAIEVERKLRALYQRKAGRDLFDLATALENPAVDPARIVAAFSEYLSRDGLKVTRAQFEKNIAAKLHDAEFAADISPLMSSGFTWISRQRHPSFRHGS